MATKSWLPIPPDSHFSLANIPFGIISTAHASTPRVAIAIGDHVLDLAAFSSNEGFALLPSIHPHLCVFFPPYLNDFAALGRPVHREVRKYLQNVFTANGPYPKILQDNESLQRLCLHPIKDVESHIPFRIGDYTDFYVGKHHAYNCGVILRGVGRLQPNYMHLPVGYHGRASSVVVSGTPIHRPWGQILENPAKGPPPIHAPCRLLDFELELGAFVCHSNAMGEPVPIEKTEDSIFGLVLMNDWSARDVQSWEMAPLGPFNSKNFGTSISAWVLLTDALEPFKAKGIENETEVMPYMREKRKENVYDMNLEVSLTPQSGTSTTITYSNAKNLLFSFPQMLAHHSVGGCPMQVGDLLGSGTISGPEQNMAGSMLELSSGGKSKVQLHGGEERTFLEDGDTVALTGWAGDTGEGLVGFGECVGRIEPAVKLQ